MNDPNEMKAIKATNVKDSVKFGYIDEKKMSSIMISPSNSRLMAADFVVKKTNQQNIHDLSSTYNVNKIRSHNSGHLFKTSGNNMIRGRIGGSNAGLTSGQDAYKW